MVLKLLTSIASWLGKLRLYFVTASHLKLIQLFYQFYYRLRKAPKGDLAGSCILIKGGRIRWPSFQTASTKDGTTFNFLGKKNEVGSGWEVSEKEKLWLYNLHYLNDAAIFDGSVQTALAKEIIESWVVNHLEKKGTAWEPYPISLRLVNVLKFYSHYRHVTPPENVLASLAEQAVFLSQRLEYNILGNHLFVNGKALIFAGVLLDSTYSEAWLRKGHEILNSEITEQFLQDGGHFERSPMYHLLVLWDLCDLINLAITFQTPLLLQNLEKWKAVVVNGILWARQMLHPDTDISFFNDACFGIAPTHQAIESYVKILGLHIPSPRQIPDLHCVHLKDSGYHIVSWADRHKLIVDVGEIGPDYQPGHAHADTLSCELSLFGQRVLVNSGISQYGVDAERNRQRSTAAHNTVEVDGENSSEVWAGFRVARRAYPFAVECMGSKDVIRVAGAHTGYRRLKGKVIHHRTWESFRGKLRVTDRLDGQYQLAIGYWHLHPDIEVSLRNTSALNLILSSGQSVLVNIDGAKIQVEPSTWHPGFGKSVPNTRIVFTFSKPTVVTDLSWSHD